MRKKSFNNNQKFVEIQIWNYHSPRIVQLSKDMHGAHVEQQKHQQSFCAITVTTQWINSSRICWSKIRNHKIKSPLKVFLFRSKITDFLDILNFYWTKSGFIAETDWPILFKSVFQSVICGLYNMKVSQKIVVFHHTFSNISYIFCDFLFIL